MVGGKSTPKKDKGMKVSCGQIVQTGTILNRGINAYKAGKNVSGYTNLHALCAGKIYFSKKKTSHGRVRTSINILPSHKPSE